MNTERFLVVVCTWAFSSKGNTEVVRFGSISKIEKSNCESKVKRPVFTYMSEWELNLCLCSYSLVRVHCEGFFLYQGFLPNKTPKLKNLALEKVPG